MRLGDDVLVRGGGAVVRGLGGRGVALVVGGWSRDAVDATCTIRKTVNYLQTYNLLCKQVHAHLNIHIKTTQPLCNMNVKGLRGACT